MRRTLGMLAATAVLLPVTSWATAGPATAAGHSLTVVTLGRSGAKVVTTATAVDLATNMTYQVRSGQARRLPKGRYAVLATIREAHSSIDTLGASVVTVSGSARTSIDARRGRQLNVSVESRPTADQQLMARICAGNDTVSSVERYGSPGQLFVVPNPARELRFVYLASSSPYLGTGSPYVVGGVTTGVPATPSRVFRQAALATVNVSARRGPAGSDHAAVAVQAGGNGCDGGISTGIHTDTTPFAVKALLSPGVWHIRSDNAADDHGQYANIGTWTSTRALAAGRTYWQGFYHSAWGPGRYLPTVIGKTLEFNTSGMFNDPGFGNDLNYGQEASQRSVSTLSLRGKVVARRNTQDWGGNWSYFSYPLKKAGWYTLSTTAKRYRPGIRHPADMLSTASSITFRFYADPKVSAVAPVFLPRFLPAGLDPHNRARPHTRTTVDLRLDRPRQGPDARYTVVRAKTVTASASFDGGRTWKPVGVKRVGTRWTAVVANPASGTVSLRARVTDAKGNSSEVTVHRAYAVG